MENHHLAMLIVVGAVALTGAALLAGYSDRPAYEESSYIDSTGMASSVVMAKRALNAGERCVVNKNCEPNGIQCCDQYSCHCAPEQGGIVPSWSGYGSRRIGKERIVRILTPEGIKFESVADEIRPIQ